MGGTIVLDYILHDLTGLRGAIVMAPALEQIGTDPWRVGLGYLLSALCPRFSLGLGLAIGARDPQLLQAFNADPLRHTQGTARLMTEFFDTVNWIESHIGELNVPLLILHGDADRVSSAGTSRQLFERITFPDTTRSEYPGLYHELHNDFDYSQVLADLLAWLAQHRG
jgi:alpha-beta hydrolase superfamily lysophospholipase